MKKICFLFFIYLQSALFAQQAEILSVRQIKDSNNIELIFKLKIRYFQTADVSIILKNKNNTLIKQFYKESAGIKRYIINLTEQDLRSLALDEASNVNYEMDIKIKGSLAKKLFILADVGWFNPNIKDGFYNFGLRAIYAGDFGSYLSVKNTNFNPAGKDYKYEYDKDKGIIDIDANKYYFLEKDYLSSSHLTLSAGIVKNLSKNVNFYVGAIYGIHKKYLRADIYQYYKDGVYLPEKSEAAKDKSYLLLDKDNSFSGMDAEGGLILNFNKFVFMAGVSTYKFTNLWINAGIGYSLNF